MGIQFQCSRCKQLIRAEQEQLGEFPKCPKCGMDLEVADAVDHSAVETPVDPLIGKQIAHYQIESLLGRGAMGNVYKAQNLRLDRSCALKMLPPEFARQDETRIKRFLREAHSAARVEHSNVLPVHFVGKVGENYFVEMQYVESGTVNDALSEKGKLEADEAARIIRDVATGLQAAHEQGIVHRDIKPSNIMLTKRGRALVADFGLATMTDMTASLTEKGIVLGTPLYISPERAMGKKGDHRSDIYSLGVMFYQLLTGRPPYTADTVAAILHHHVYTPVPEIRKELPHIVPFLAGIVTRMMEKDPEARYQTCEELVEDLNRYLGETASQAAAESKRPFRAGVKNRWFMPLVVGLIPTLIVIGAVVSYFVLRGGAPRSPRPSHPAPQPLRAAKPSPEPEPEATRSGIVAKPKLGRPGEEIMKGWKIFDGEWRAHGSGAAGRTGLLQWVERPKSTIDLECYFTAQKLTDSGFRYVQIVWGNGEPTLVPGEGDIRYRVRICPGAIEPSSQPKNSELLGKRIPYRLPMGQEVKLVAEITPKGVHLNVGRSIFTAEMPIKELRYLQVGVCGIETVFSKLEAKTR